MVAVEANREFEGSRGGIKRHHPSHPAAAGQPAGAAGGPLVSRVALPGGPDELAAARHQGTIGQLSPKRLVAERGKEARQVVQRMDVAKRKGM